jgi:hypothetical protein
VRPNNPTKQHKQWFLTLLLRETESAGIFINYDKIEFFMRLCAKPSQAILCVLLGGFLPFANSFSLHFQFQSNLAAACQ